MFEAGRFSYRWCAGFGLLIAAASPLRASEAPSFFVTEMPTVLHQEHFPTSLNDAGHVAGNVFDDGYRNVSAFYWSRESGYVPVTPGWDGDSFAAAINNRDEIVGKLETEDGLKRAFLWRDGTWSDLEDIVPPGSGWTFREARDINDLGHIVGEGSQGGFLLIPGEPYYEIVALRTLLGRSVSPRAINNRGSIVGRFVGYPDGLFLWTGDTLIALGTLGGNGGEALDVNESNQVVGYAQTERNENYGHAFLWENGVMHDLGTLGGASSYAFRINNEGLIQGGAESLLAWTGEACIWVDRRIHRLADLVPCSPDAKLSFEWAGLNDLGQIATQEYAGEFDAPWLLTPTRKAAVEADVSVFRGTTIELRVATPLPENSFVSARIDGGDCVRIPLDRRGKGRHRWLNQEGPHEVCVEQHPDLCFAVECDPRPETFVITRLPALVEGAEADAAALNDRGEIVGHSDTWYGRYEFHAALWRNLQPVDLGTLGGPTSYAYDNNESGWIAGASENAAGDMRPFGGDEGWATSVNNLGQVVGRASDDTRFAAFLWSDGIMQQIPCPDDSSNCYPEGINDGGEVVGSWYDDNNNTHGFRWSEDAGLRILEELEESVYVQDIAEDGTACGRAFDPEVRAQVPALWDRDGRLTTLPLLDGRGGRSLGIASRAVVVGFEQKDPATRHAMLWREGIAFDLNDLISSACGWDYLDAALDVNNSGQIIGAGYAGGLRLPFLLSPAYAGNVRKLSARCKGRDLVVRVKSWLPDNTSLTVVADVDREACLRTDAAGRGKALIRRAADSEAVCIRDYEDTCVAVSCR